jgi:hypothetical protein
MVDVELRVVLEPSQLELKLLRIVESVRAAKLLNFLEAVAKSSAGFSGVVAVVAHAQPAEFVPALATRHVHTALVLFNNNLALRARFGVEFDPEVGVFIRVAHPV